MNFIYKTNPTLIVKAVGYYVMNADAIEASFCYKRKNDFLTSVGELIANTYNHLVNTDCLAAGMGVFRPLSIEPRVPVQISCAPV